MAGFLAMREPAHTSGLGAARARMGMFALIAAESTIFAIFVVAYLFYLGKSTSGPQPSEVLSAPIFYTVCLLSSSITLEIALRRFRQARTASFALAWSATIVLGGAFLYGTATEWRRLIYVDDLTISTNLFGTTYYSLVGLHASHVIIGLLLLSVVMVFALFGLVKLEHAEHLEVLSLYWHFVDAVWIVVVAVVYVIGR
jgi:cytochrome c oxidase subunit 3/cytochrome o ubiquinol oxidase subunit 3